MKLASKMLVLGTICALSIAGLTMAFADQDDPSAVAAETPVVAIQSFGSDMAEEEAILVTANVSGESVPMSGVRVTICKMNVTAEGEQLTFRVMEMTALQTGVDGKVRYNFSEGSKYMICSENQGQRGFTNMNMNQTEANLCYAHQWNWSNMNGQTFTQSGSGQGVGVAQGQAVIQAVNGDTEQGRLRSQDRSC
jgi:hypothetical protein